MITYVLINLKYLPNSSNIMENLVETKITL
jgi:hypothetical protein